MQLPEFLGRCSDLRKSGDGWIAGCPAHDDCHASLSIGEGKDGRILLKCHAGCDTARILDVMELAAADLFPHGHSGQTNGKPRIIAVYDYRDEQGTLLFQAVRFDPKDFRQRVSDGNGGWTWKLGRMRRVLYRLPELLAAPKEQVVVIVEGEKDVDQLVKLGLVATTNPMGAGKWRSEYSEFLRGRHVVILPDNDEPGRMHAEQVAASLVGVAASIKVLPLPCLSLHGDVSDWLDTGGTAEELLRLAAGAPAWQKPEPLRAKPTENGISNTDVGNGRRLARTYGDDFRHCFVWRKDLIWDGKRWSAAATGQLEVWAKEVVRALYAQAARERDEERRTALAKHATKSEHIQRLHAMIALARSEPRIPILPSDLDRDPWSLNCGNGTVDLRTGTLREHRREDFLTKLAPVLYDPQATAPVWEAFLRRIFAGNEVLIGYVQRFFGYCLTGKVSEHVLVILWGSGANGKSTLLNTILYVLGQDYAIKAGRDLFMAKKQDGHPAQIARLFGKRLVACVESQEDGRLDEALVKELTGGDPIAARRMREDPWQFDPTHKAVLVTNFKPRLRPTDEAMWRRVRLVPFTVTLPEHEQDKDLPEKLKAEASGILAWLMRGCLEWQQSGLGTPEEVTRATNEYRNEQDLIGSFLAEMCQQGPDYRVRASALHAAHVQWCKRSGEEHVNQRVFGATMTERNFERCMSNGTWYLGVGLRGGLETPAEG
jgi:putative DNA primase/helicase